ncbi:hypothetical protein [Mesorhizobium sp. WSM2239]|uniref:Uncharacterized protein n=2 Tax=unclassified Mesorhizobium TaxID=325217 RepID=A0AAU8DE73_9HYPH
MTEHLLELRETHSYVGSYAHLDSWIEIGTYVFEIQGQTVHTNDEDPCDPTEAKHMVRVTSDQPADKIKEALIDTHSRHGCAHEWDCCGCRSFAADAEQIKDDLWMLTITSSRNY